MGTNKRTYPISEDSIDEGLYLSNGKITFDFGIGDGSDGALTVTDGQEVTLNLNQLYQYTSIDIQAGGKVYFEGEDGVAKVACQGDCNIAGDVYLIGNVVNTSDLSFTSEKGDTVTSDETTATDAGGTGNGIDPGGTGGNALGAGDGTGGVGDAANGANGTLVLREMDSSRPI